MTFAITIDAERWFAAQAKVFTKYNQSNELIAVIKSNGYGIGQDNLAKVAAHHKLQRVAVGTVYEVSEVAANFTGEIVVLEPVNPLDINAWQMWEKLLNSALSTRLILTIADAQSFETVKAVFNSANVVFEIRTEMNRFGTYASQSNWLGLADLTGVTPKGFTAHFPHNSKLLNLIQLLDFAVQNSARFGNDVALSHIPAEKFQQLSKQYPTLNLRLRVGTEFWLGDRGALKVTGTVLEVHSTVAAETVGYQSRRVTKNYVVVSGGTAHGIGLSAPSVNKNLRQRFTALALGGLNSLGRNLSPFRVAGKKLWFLEPPHQHVSMLFLQDVQSIKVGQELDAEIRFTTTRADVIRGLDL